MKSTLGVLGVDASFPQRPRVIRPEVWVGSPRDTVENSVRLLGRELCGYVKTAVHTAAFPRPQTVRAEHGPAARQVGVRIRVQPNGRSMKRSFEY